jgi:NitT/TauT family transport system ATP-binding protein
MIEARNISKYFRPAEFDRKGTEVTALQSVSLTIEDGSFVALIGPTGCGKSTFLEILAGLQAPSQGEVWIDGTRVLEPLPATRTEMVEYHRRYRFLSPIANSLFRNNPKHDIAMIFQDYAVFPWMTARQNVLFTLKLRGVSKRDREELAQYYLNMVHLGGSESKYPSQMSGGMRQRLALARALSVEPKIILMDEPFAAVDAFSKDQLREELLAIWEKAATTIILVTHDIDEALLLADVIYLFSPAPGTISSRVVVNIARPRNRNSPELIRLREQILSRYR